MDTSHDHAHDDAESKLGSVVDVKVAPVASAAQQAPVALSDTVTTAAATATQLML